jgi:pilus assembly protein CpaD
MTHLPHALRALATAATMALVACGSLHNGPQQAFNPMTSFPITVEPRMMTLQLPYRDGTALDETMQEQLSRFAQDYLEHGSGAIAISAIRGNPDAAGYFAERLADLGVPQGRVLVTNDDVEMGDQVKITFIRYFADPTPCGNWSVSLASTDDNRTAPNLGCATQHNIAVLVADPRDLVAPQPLSPGDAAHSLAVLQKYREGKPTVSEKAAEQSGNVADVAQK